VCVCVCVWCVCLCVCGVCVCVCGVWVCVCVVCVCVWCVGVYVCVCVRARICILAVVFRHAHTFFADSCFVTRNLSHSTIFFPQYFIKSMCSKYIQICVLVFRTNLSEKISRSKKNL